MASASEIESKLKTYIMAEFLAGEDPAQLTGSTPLVTSGVLDSIATLRLVSFLEQEFAISVDAHEVGADNFDTIESIVRLVISKQRA